MIKNSKTHCTHGHKFTPENTYIRPDGYRQCRECMKFNNKVFKIRLISLLIKRA